MSFNRWMNSCTDRFFSSLVTWIDSLLYNYIIFFLIMNSFVLGLQIFNVKNGSRVLEIWKTKVQIWTSRKSCSSKNRQSSLWDRGWRRMFNRAPLRTPVLQIVRNRKATDLARGLDGNWGSDWYHYLHFPKLLFLPTFL